MIRKYFPYILLLIAACCYLFIKTHQRGGSAPYHRDRSIVDTSSEAPVNDDAEGFSRNPHRIIYSRHAHCRMDCRHIDEAEVKEILKTGVVNKRKIETDSRGTTYPVEGISQGHHLRIVFSPKGEDAVEVVTCIDLDRDWPCNCN